MKIVLKAPEERLHEKLLVGVIQTTLDGAVAWPKDVGPPMAENEAERTWGEVHRAVTWLMDGPSKPQIVIFPELSIGRPYQRELIEIAKSSGSVLIAGLDYALDVDSGSARNEAVVIAPSTWPKGSPARNVTVTRVGKTYPAPKERAGLQQTPRNWTFQHDPNLWIFDAGPFGKFAVCICYDLMDVDRPVLYRCHIHHLFALAYNQDVHSFAHIAEAICRTVYCNVVVCNTGHFGGSLVLSPYYESHRRPSYRLEGQRLVGVQCIEVPVAAIQRAWEGNRGNGDDKMKNLPPGFMEHHQLRRRRTDL